MSNCLVLISGIFCQES